MNNNNIYYAFCYAYLTMPVSKRQTYLITLFSRISTGITVYHRNAQSDQLCDKVVHFNIL